MAEEKEKLDDDTLKKLLALIQQQNQAPTPQVGVDSNIRQDALQTRKLQSDIETQKVNNVLAIQNAKQAQSDAATQAQQAQDQQKVSAGMVLAQIQQQQQQQKIAAANKNRIAAASPGQQGDNLVGNFLRRVLKPFDPETGREGIASGFIRRQAAVDVPGSGLAQQLEGQLQRNIDTFLQNQKEQKATVKATVEAKEQTYEANAARIEDKRKRYEEALKESKKNKNKEQFNLLRSLIVNDPEIANSFPGLETADPFKKIEAEAETERIKEKNKNFKDTLSRLGDRLNEPDVRSSMRSKIINDPDLKGKYQDIETLTAEEEDKIEKRIRIVERNGVKFQITSEKPRGAQEEFVVTESKELEDKEFTPGTFAFLTDSPEAMNLWDEATRILRREGLLQEVIRTKEQKKADEKAGKKPKTVFDNFLLRKQVKDLPIEKRTTLVKLLQQFVDGVTIQKIVAKQLLAATGG